MGQIQPATNQCQDECLPLTDAVEELRQLLKTHCDLVGSVENNHVCASFVGKNTRESLWQEWGWMRASVVSLSSIVSVINTSSVVHGHVSMWVHPYTLFILISHTYHFRCSQPCHLMWFRSQSEIQYTSGSVWLTWVISWEYVIRCNKW